MLARNKLYVLAKFSNPASALYAFWVLYAKLFAGSCMEQIRSQDWEITPTRPVSSQDLEAILQKN